MAGIGDEGRAAAVRAPRRAHGRALKGTSAGRTQAVDGGAHAARHAPAMATRPPAPAAAVAARGGRRGAATPHMHPAPRAGHVGAGGGGQEGGRVGLLGKGKKVAASGGGRAAAAEGKQRERRGIAEAFLFSYPSRRRLADGTTSPCGGDIYPAIDVAAAPWTLGRQRCSRRQWRVGGCGSRRGGDRSRHPAAAPPPPVGAAARPAAAVSAAPPRASKSRLFSHRAHGSAAAVDRHAAERLTLVLWARAHQWGWLLLPGGCRGSNDGDTNRTSIDW